MGTYYLVTFIMAFLFWFDAKKKAKKPKKRKYNSESYAHDIRIYKHGKKFPRKNARRL